MIAEFLNRQIVRDELSKIRLDLEKDIKSAPADASQQQLLAELTAAQERETRVSSGQQGFEPTVPARRGSEPAPLDDFAFISHDPIISLLQSALDQWAEMHPEEVLVTPPADDSRRGPEDPVLVTSRRLKAAPEPQRIDGRRIFEKFSVTDVGWVRSKIAEGIRLFRGKHAFKDTPARPVVLPSRVRLVIVGDWGSGLPRAQKVATQMRVVLEEGKSLGLTQHVVHLGDVYYSGWAHEYQRRFLPYWPVRPEEAGTINSWAINSNHDMYSGGYGYFDLLLADDRFVQQQGSSVFSMSHPDWNILALDTAWDEGSLHGDQVNWLREQLADKRKSLLLSHHQLFSAYDSTNDKLVEQVAPLLERTPVKAWFWGHEHRCVAYSAHSNVEFGRCIGHGGIPVYMCHGAEDPYPSPAIYEDRRYYAQGLERWALFGFVVLDVDGPVMTVRYIDENGQCVHRETLV